MKHLCMCIAALAMGTLFVVHVGCDQANRTGKAALEAGHAVASDQLRQLEIQLNDASTLSRAKVQLANAQNSRAELKKIADQFHIDSEVALRQIRRLEDEKDKIVDDFTKLQDAARNAGLPRLADATPEDKAKSIRIGTLTLTGDEVYRNLARYRTQVENANTAIERERKQSDFLKDRAEKIRSQMSRVDANIADMERQIADYEMYQRLLAANQKIESLGLSDGKMNELLNTDSNLAELRRKVDAWEVEIDMIDNRARDREVDDGLRRPSFSITEDDLI